VKKLLSEIHGLTWTLAGTGMVLITLSGDTLSWGVWITILGLVVHCATLFAKGDDNE
jgi:hypothetical protein